MYLFEVINYVSVRWGKMNLLSWTNRAASDNAHAIEMAFNGLSIAELCGLWLNMFHLYLILSKLLPVLLHKHALFLT